MSILKIGDIDYTKNPVKPILKLCKPSKEIINIVDTAYEIELDTNLGSLNELNFKIPIFIEKHHASIRNPIADIIKGRYLILLELGVYKEYFLINQINKSSSKDEYIEVKSLSLAYELNDKIIRDYEVTSYTAQELMDDMLKDTIWKVKYIDSEFLKHRSFSVSSETVMEAIINIAKTYNALLQWDSINREVSLFRPENIGADRGFSISYGKYLESINQEDNSEEIVTRLKMFGKEEMSIHEITPTGQSYIEDFNYFVYPYQETYSEVSYNFSPLGILHDWNKTGLSSDFSANSSNLVIISPNGVKSIVNHDNIENYKLNSIIKPNGGNGNFSLMVRYQNNNNYYKISYHKNDSNNTNYLKIIKVENGVSTILETSKIVTGWSLNMNYKMSVEVNGNHILVWIDNVLVCHTTDKSFSFGRYGFSTEECSISISNVNVLEMNRSIISHSEFMSDDLCHYLIRYDNLLNGSQDEFKTLVDIMTSQKANIDIFYDRLTELDIDLKILLDERDILNTRIARQEDNIYGADNTEQPTGTLSALKIKLISERDSKLIEIQEKQNEINDWKSQIIVLESDYEKTQYNISLYRIKIDIKNNFPLHLLKERNQFIIEKEWQDTNITRAEALLEEGLKVFEEYRKQKITVNVDIVNFLAMISEQKNWDKLNLGDEFNIEHERLNVKYKAKITAIKYSFEKNSIDITISNIKDLYSNKNKFLDMLYKAHSTSTSVSMKDWEWDLALENKGSINEIINNIWDANKQAIIGAKDQVVEISDRGLIIRDENDPLKYLVAINGMIALTNDGGNTFKHAITTDGIVGERIYGKVIMGVNLAIEDETGILTIQGSRVKIFDRDRKPVMQLGLVEEDGLCGEAFGLIASNDITRVKVTDCEGFVVERVDPSSDSGWEKVFWTSIDGTLYAHDLVTSNLKVVSNKDWSNEILNSETGFFDIGWFKTIVKDGKLTTDEKLQLITELTRIYSGYKLLLSQASKYIKAKRDDYVDVEEKFNTTTGEFPTSKSNRNRYSTSSLTEAYISLVEYMKSYVGITSNSPHNPLVIDINASINQETQEIKPDRGTFILKFKDYYDEADKIKNEIEDAIVYQGLTLGANYNNVFINEYGLIVVRDDGMYRAYLNATHGLALEKWENDTWVKKLYASIGNDNYSDGTLIAEELVAKKLRIETKNDEVLLDMDSLIFDFTTLDAITYDDIIMSPEKSTLSAMFDSINSQYSMLISQLDKYIDEVYKDRDASINIDDVISDYYGIDLAVLSLKEAKSNLTDSYNALKEKLDIVFIDMNEKTIISIDLLMTKAEFDNLFKDFSAKFELARNSLENFLEKSSLQLGRNYNNTIIDAEHGVTVFRGNMTHMVQMNATEGFSLSRNDGTYEIPEWTDLFYVNTDGGLYAQDITTHNLKIVDGNLGEKIIFDENDGITINGNNGEQIRLNGNEGIAIDVDGDERFWVGTDGLLYAKKLVIMDEFNQAIVDKVTGSFISDLTVNKVKTLNNNNPSRYIHIEDDYIKVKVPSYIAGTEEQSQWSLDFRLKDGVTAPVMQWGGGSNIALGKNIGYQWKSSVGFFMQYVDVDGYERNFGMHRDSSRSIFMQSPHDIIFNSDTKITFKIDDNNYIAITKAGVTIKGNVINLN